MVEGVVEVVVVVGRWFGVEVASRASGEACVGWVGQGVGVGWAAGRVMARAVAVARVAVRGSECAASPGCCWARRRRAAPSQGGGVAAAAAADRWPEG